MNANVTSGGFQTTVREVGGKLLIVSEVNRYRYGVIVFGFGLVILLGFLGNGICMYVQIRMMRLEGISSRSFCILCLTLANLLSILVGATNHWFTQLIPFSVENYAVWTCKIHYFLTRLMTESSIWFQVIFSLMRLVAVTWPHKVHLIFSLRTVKLCTLFAMCFVTASNLPRVLAYEIIKYPGVLRCLIADNSFAYASTILDFFSVLILPDLILFFTTLMVGYELGMAMKTKSSLVHSQFQSQPEKEMLAEESVRGTTRYMFINNFTYIICYAPALIYKVYEAYSHPFISALTEDEANFIDFMYRISNLPLYAYHAIYWAFLFTGSKYRHAFSINLICIQL